MAVLGQVGEWMEFSLADKFNEFLLIQRQEKGMKSINVKRSALLDALRNNRQKHATEAEEAKAGYIVQVEKGLRKALRELKTGKITTNLNLHPPVDQTAEYDRAIQMMEMSVDDNIELTEIEFRQYIQDEWSWRAAASLLNTTYAAAGKAK